MKDATPNQSSDTPADTTATAELARLQMIADKALKEFAEKVELLSEASRNLEEANGKFSKTTPIGPKSIDLGNNTEVKISRNQYGLRVEPPCWIGATIATGATDAVLLAALLSGIARAIHKAHSLTTSLWLHATSAQEGNSIHMPEEMTAEEIGDISYMASSEAWGAYETCKLYSKLLRGGLVSEQLAADAEVVS
jgi:hypothetical protein